MLVFAFQQGGTTAAGVVALVQLVPAAIFAPVGGLLADRRRPEGVLAGGYVAQAAMMGATAAVLIGGGAPWLAYAFAAAVTTAITITRPAQAVLAPGLARTAEELTGFNVVIGWIESAAVLVAPALTGILLAFGSPGLVFALSAVATLVAGFLILPLRTGKTRPPTTQPIWEGAVADVLAGFRAVAVSPRVRLLVVFLVAQCVALGAFDVIAVVLALDVLDLGESGRRLPERRARRGRRPGRGRDADPDRPAPPRSPASVRRRLLRCGLRAARRVPDGGRRVRAPRRGRRRQHDRRSGRAHAPPADRTGGPARPGVRALRGALSGLIRARRDPGPGARGSRRREGCARCDGAAASLPRPAAVQGPSHDRRGGDGPHRRDLASSLDADLRSPAGAGPRGARAQPRAGSNGAGDGDHPRGRRGRSFLRNRRRGGRDQPRGQAAGEAAVEATASARSRFSATSRARPP